MEYYDLETIPKKRNPRWACYDNKPLKNWDSDDFANFIMDHSKNNGKFNASKTFLADDTNMCEILECTPENFSRIYLYGVWEVLKDRIKANKKIKVLS